MENRKAMLITGPAKSGKTYRARKEAEKLGGNHVVTSWENLTSAIGLAAIMKSSPSAIIIEGLPVSALTKPEKIKSIIGGDKQISRGLYQNPKLITLPKLIFTMQKPVPKIDDFILQRFEVVELSQR